MKSDKWEPKITYALIELLIRCKKGIKLKILKDPKKSKKKSTNYDE